VLTNSLPLNVNSVKSDPYLNLRPLLIHGAGTANSPSQQTEIQSKYRREMLHLFLEQKNEEEKRIEQSKAFLLEYLTGVHKFIDKITKQLNESIVKVTSIDAVEDIQHFIEQNQLNISEEEKQEQEELAGAATAATATQPKINESATSTESTTSETSTISNSDAATTSTSTELSATPTPPPATSAPTKLAVPLLTVFDLQPPVRDSSLYHRMAALEIAKEGSLTRPGRFFKGNWKSQFIVLTRSGFLHCFEERDALTPVFTLSLLDCHSQIPKKEPTLIEVVHTHPAVFGKKEVQTINPFKAATPQEALEWSQAITAQCFPSVIGAPLSITTTS